MATSDFSRLNYLIQNYENTILTDEFRLRIRARELERLFPFSLHNIYRVLLSIAGTFFEGYKIVLDHLDDKQISAYLGPPSRVFRYFHVILFGALQNWTPENLNPLNHLADLAYSRIDSQANLTTGDFLIPVKQSLEEKKLIVTLAVFLREFVDLLHMGQHDQGFMSYPPLETNEKTTVVRQYFRLPSEITLAEAIDVYTFYAPEIKGQLHYDRFRGDIERLPPPNDLQAAVALLPDFQRSLTIAEVKAIIAAISQQMNVERDHLNKLTTLEAEKKLIEMFCVELFDLLHLCSDDTVAWKERLNRDLDKTYAQESADPSRIPASYTDLYVGHLKTSLGDLKEILRNAETI